MRLLRWFVNFLKREEAKSLAEYAAFDVVESANVLALTKRRRPVADALCSNLLLAFFWELFWWAMPNVWIGWRILLYLLPLSTVIGQARYYLHVRRGEKWIFDRGNNIVCHDDLIVEHLNRLDFVEVSEWRVEGPPPALKLQPHIGKPIRINATSYASELIRVGQKIAEFTQLPFQHSVNGGDWLASRPTMGQKLVKKEGRNENTNVR